MSDTPSPSLAAFDEAIAASRSEARRALLRGLRAVVAAELEQERAAHDAAIAGIVEGLRVSANEHHAAADMAPNLTLRTMHDGAEVGLLAAVECANETHAAALARHAAEVERVRGVEAAIRSLGRTLATNARDWSLDRADAWLYGALCGWDEALPEVAARHGWSAEDVAHLEAIRATLNANAVELRAARERTAALEAEATRLRDLVRYQRAPLHDADLITDEECAALAADHGAVARLEGYDAARTRIAALEAALVECSRIGTLAMEEAKHLTHALDVIRADCERAGIPGEVDVPDPDSDDPAPIREWRTTVGLVTIALAQRDTARAAGVREGRAMFVSALVSQLRTDVEECGGRYTTIGAVIWMLADAIERGDCPPPAAPPVAEPAGALPDGFRLEGEAAMCGGKGPDRCRKGASCRKHNRCVYGGAFSRTGGAS